jgi:hypothetical protein
MRERPESCKWGKSGHRQRAGLQALDMANHSAGIIVPYNTKAREM